MFQNTLEVYEAFCQPVCKKYKMPQTAFDILMFLANNPEMQTAKEISRSRGIKRSMVSFHVDKLVKNGYLERHSIAKDRRQVKLVCTEKANPVIKDGRDQQKKFFDCITNGFTDEDKEQFVRIQNLLKSNVMAYKEKIKKGSC